MSSADFTYDHVGASRDPDYCPPGFHHLRERTRLGEGEKVFRQAADALFGWEMHREMGVGVDASAERAASDVDVTVTLAGVVRAPCRVVWAEEEYRRAGWAYGTLAGHPESGEEAFVVHRTGDGTVWLTVSAFSRPARWYARAGGPATRTLQHAYARRCGRVLRRLATRGVTDA
ncbi:DUF1990 domain-containing protein [Streptomyces pseudogriseolus]|uniref:DUF1990 domain-containing protein n=4 Tax=Streptomyces TaxID=1883 RepID=M3DB50_STREZ|nr:MULTISPECIES: DUF1990 domain-containing protein [Streptomyces]MCM3302841.1 DUF1990 domain-containing protein [Streptomyces pseudogriseolus]GGQ22075.1 DUF1990 domain-containing protein [Streptomyces gancidicus]EMF27000.1 hypothetical protein H114_21038 [Streptomyces gancidicus BKS 13-15]MCI4141236.1 DUF1990 domain-containing protein [Streptomyces sp. MMS20-AI2-20]GGS69488.1 DUF1990 domain-containing protein [Streptomyces rubiginosus]